MNARRVHTGDLNSAEFRLDKDDRIRFKVSLPDPGAPRRRIRDYEDDPGYIALTFPF